MSDIATPCTDLEAIKTLETLFSHNHQYAAIVSIQLQDYRRQEEFDIEKAFRETVGQILKIQGESEETSE